MQTGSRLAARIDEFGEQAETLWRDYLRLGPGKLEPGDANGVFSAAAEIEHTVRDPDVARWLEHVPHGTQLDELQTQITQLTRLARACASTPQGLNFITGEAGLIPRRDQHEAFESGLVKLREMAADLHQQC